MRAIYREREREKECWNMREIYRDREREIVGEQEDESESE